MFGLMEGPDQTPLSAKVVRMLTFKLVRPLVGRVSGACSGDYGERSRGKSDVDADRQAAPRAGPGAPGQQARRRGGRKQRSPLSPFSLLLWRKLGHVFISPNA